MGWHVDLKSQVSGLADLLSDIHDREMRISALLHEFGFPDDAIDTARQRHMAAIAALLVEAIRNHVRVGPRGMRHCEILMRRYGLAGEGRETLGCIGVGMGISRERVRQLQQQALRRCRARQHQWKNGFHDAVRDFFWANEPPPASTLTGRADGEPTA